MPTIDVEDAPPPPSTPDEVTAAERYWRENVYRGDSLPELTFQVFVISLGLGALLLAFNIHMGLKTGWAEGLMGVAIAIWAAVPDVWAAIAGAG